VTARHQPAPSNGIRTTIMQNIGLYIGLVLAFTGLVTWAAASIGWPALALGIIAFLVGSIVIGPTGVYVTNVISRVVVPNIRKPIVASIVGVALLIGFGITYAAATINASFAGADRTWPLIFAWALPLVGMALGFAGNLIMILGIGKAAASYIDTAAASTAQPASGDSNGFGGRDEPTIPRTMLRRPGPSGAGADGDRRVTAKDQRPDQR
jgi:hypothetical protein